MVISFIIKLNPKVFFSFAKKRKIAVSSVGPLLDENNILHDDAKTMGEILQKQYCSVFSDPDMVDLDSICEVNPQHTLSDITFGAPQIIAAIKLMDQVMKMSERVIAKLIRERININIQRNYMAM